MRNLLTITTNTFVQTLQKNLSSLDFWSDSKDSVKVRDQLRNGANICERWSIAVEQLTGFYWKNYPAHQWKGEPFKATYLLQFKHRLNQIISIRSAYDQCLRVSSTVNRENFPVTKVFSPFFNLNPIQFNPYADPQWTAAVGQYESIMSTIDRDVARQLREYFQKLRSNPQQMLVELKRYNDLIQRDVIRQELASERETLLNQFENELRDLNEDFKSLNNGGKKANKTVIAFELDTSRQIEAKVIEFNKNENK